MAMKPADITSSLRSHAAAPAIRSALPPPSVTCRAASRKVPSWWSPSPQTTASLTAPWARSGCPPSKSTSRTQCSCSSERELGLRSPGSSGRDVEFDRPRLQGARAPERAGGPSGLHFSWRCDGVLRLSSFGASCRNTFQSLHRAPESRVERAKQLRAHVMTPTVDCRLVIGCLPSVADWAAL